MSSAPNTADLPNPFTPMAFLPPELSSQLTIAIYVWVGSLAVLIWDILNNLRGDLALVFNYPLKLPSVVYFSSRLAVLAFTLTLVVYSTAPVNVSCWRLYKVIGVLFALAVSSTSLLFLIRLIAIFDRNKYVKIFFCAMWLAVLGGTLTAVPGMTGGSIGPTRYCINKEMKSYVGVAAVIPLVNDTLVFLAISWSLMTISYASDPLRGGLRAFFHGDYLPAFSRGLLQDGQVYYLATVTTNLMTAVIFFTSVPIVYRAMFGVPNAVLMNIMACRVYTRTKYGYHKNLGTSLRASSKTNENVIPLTFAANRNLGGMGPGHAIEVVKTVEEHSDQFEDQKAQRYRDNSHRSSAV